MKKLLVYAVILFVGGVFFVSCAKKRIKATAEQTAEKTLGAIILDTRGEWMSELYAGLEKGGRISGMNVSITSSDGDISKESGIIDTLITKGVDAIAFMPQNDQGSVAAFERAVNSGVPVVTMNSKVDSPLSKVFVGVDNYTLGKMAGDYAVGYINEKMGGNATVGILSISKYSIGIERVNGFVDQIKKLPGVKIVAQQDAEYAEEALGVTESMLEAHQDIDFLWAWNLTSMLGGIAALKGREDNGVVMMGTDMSIDVAKTMLEENTFLKAVSTQQPYKIGQVVVSKAAELLKTGVSDNTTLVPVTIYTSDDKDSLQKYIDDRDYLEN